MLQNALSQKDCDLLINEARLKNEADSPLRHEILMSLFRLCVITVIPRTSPICLKISGSLLDRTTAWTKFIHHSSRAEKFVYKTENSSQVYPCWPKTSPATWERWRSVPGELTDPVRSYSATEMSVKLSKPEFSRAWMNLVVGHPSVPVRFVRSEIVCLQIRLFLSNDFKQALGPVMNAVIRRGETGPYLEAILREVSATLGITN